MNQEQSVEEERERETGNGKATMIEDTDVKDKTTKGKQRNSEI